MYTSHPLSSASAVTNIAVAKTWTNLAHALDLCVVFFRVTKCSTFLALQFS